LGRPSLRSSHCVAAEQTSRNSAASPIIEKPATALARDEELHIAEQSMRRGDLSEHVERPKLAGLVGEATIARGAWE